MRKSILSLFDHSGSWSAPYKKAGYVVYQHDLKRGWDIFEDTIPAALEDARNGLKIHGILSAPPCTDFASSGAQYWKKKDTMPPNYESRDIEFDTSTDHHVGMVMAVLLLVEIFDPVWWVIENPVGRIAKLCPDIGPPRLIFQPYEFGDLYSKRTVLYGEFNVNLKRNPALPIMGSLHDKYRSADKRSITPRGFAQSFFEANP